MSHTGCKFFRELTLRICGSLDISKAMFDTYCLLKQYVPVEEISYTFFDTDMEAIRFVAFADDEGGRDLNMAPMPITPEIVHWLKTDIAQNDCYIMNDTKTAQLSKIVTEFRSFKPKSSILVQRLIIDGVFLGSFNLCCSGSHRYKEEHIALMAQIKEPLGAAMAHWRRYHEVTQLKALLDEDVSFLKAELSEKKGMDIVGSEFGLKEVMSQLRKVAPLNSVVLLQGETGTGKEVIAHAIHRLSNRRKGPFITMNCGAIPETLIDSELFGHEKGAYTGASETKRGRFERAHGGTIFLDEIGELPMGVQSRLLRVLQEREIERVGGKAPIKVNIRIIAATHRNLDKMVEEASFRQDLLFRLKVFPIHIPPLRMRKTDIPALAQHFVEKKCRDMNIKKLPTISPAAINTMLNYNWPGNVRELENLIERDLILNRKGPLELAELASPSQRTRIIENTKADNQNISDSIPIATLDAMIAEHIKKALSHCHGQVEGDAGAAKLLNINPNTLRARMRKLGIVFGRQTKT